MASPIHRDPNPTPSSDSQEEYDLLRLIYFCNELPHDNLSHFFRRLWTQSKDRNHPILANFINESTAAIREEIRQLPTPLRQLIPPFQTIFDFVEDSKLRKGPLAGPVESLLLAAIQLAAFIGHYERNPETYSRDAAGGYLTGLGLGLLVTAAVSLSPTLSDLPLAGAEVVRTAFRFGALVQHVSSNLEPRRDGTDAEGPDSWAYVVADVTPERAQKELDKVQAKEEISEVSKIFISALSKNSVTISGPPGRLRWLFRTSDFFRDAKCVELPVYDGLCHAKHIYNHSHAREIVNVSAAKLNASRFIPTRPILSVASGRPFGATNASELLEGIVFEILTQVVRWDTVTETVSGWASSMGVSRLHVQAFRTSAAIRDLIATVETSIPQIEIIETDFILWATETRGNPISPRGPQQSKIAIVGMACRMPGGATDTEKLWDLLDKGLDVHRKIPKDRFDFATHCDPSGKTVNASHTQYGCFIDEPGLFDAPFFNMSPREAEQTDPMQRLALVTAYEALERAGYVANRTAATDLHRIGTFYGQASDDYREVNSAQEVSTYFIPGGCRAFGPGRINYFFKFSGPSYSIDTACSSGLATVQAACTALWNGEVDTVVAGGMNVLTNSDCFAGLSHGHFLSKTPNACKTWDSEADGYCRADGVGSIVMKRLEDAEADNDNILGVILGAGTNHSAEAVSITHPHAGAQAYLSRQILSKAGINPLDVSYVEMHGTGTQAGDREEMQSVVDVYAPLVSRRTPKQALYIGAIKANVGHGEAAAGIMALLKVLVMFEKGAIPPHVGVKNKLNPNFPKDLQKRNLNIPWVKTPWERSQNRKRIAVVNNFGAAGGNTSLLIEEGPLRGSEGEIDVRGSTHVVAVSAKSKVSLRGNLERLIHYVEEHPDASIPNLSYTTTARRAHHNYRLAVAISTVADLKKQLGSFLKSADSHKPVNLADPPSIAFSFPGQGSPYKSSNYELFHTSPTFRAEMLRLDELGQQQGFPSFIPAIDGSHPQDHQHSPVVSQLSLVCTEMALSKYWASLGIKPDVVVGHSLGEYAALQIAGVLSASDAIFLVGRRAQLLEKHVTNGHQMLAVRAAVGEVEQCITNQPFEVACINGPKETVLSGTTDEVEALLAPLQSAGHKCTILDVPFAFHSAQMDPILDEFEELAKRGVVFRAPNIPVVSPLLGRVVFDEQTFNATYLRRATRETVNFLTALEAAKQADTVNSSMGWIEIGPHPVSTSFVKATLSPSGPVVATMRRGEDNWVTLARSLAALHSAGVEVGWNEFHRPYEKRLRLLDLPTYSWNNKTHWIQYEGDWALTKGNKANGKEGRLIDGRGAPASPSSFITSTVQQIIHESYTGSTAGTVTMQSDLMQPDFRAAAYGHKMNGCGVVTSSIHADIVFTLAQYLFKKLRPHDKKKLVNIANLDVLKGLVAQKKTDTPQYIQVSISTENISTGVAHLLWHNVLPDGTVEEAFASAQVWYEDASQWPLMWKPLDHLILGRIEALERLAAEGVANRFSHTMAYRLFAANLVDYAEKYRGMQSVVLDGLEAFADVTLTEEKGGVWTIPPFFIDSIAHLAGFVMNVSDAVDTAANFCVTPGWGSLRFAGELVAGAKYRSYVKMIPTEEDPSVYLGDIYVLQENTIIGLVGGMKFRRYPRLLLDRFFSAPDEVASRHKEDIRKPTIPVVVQPVHQAPVPSTLKTVMAPAPNGIPGTTPPVEPAVDIDSDSTTAKALRLVAGETGLRVEDLDDQVSFPSLGVDSLMSLVISEKFREELGVTVGASLFLEYPTVGDLKAWLLEYYS